MPEDTVFIFTAKSIETLLEEGGTSRWRLDRNHVRQCTYAVCTRNAHASWTEGPEPHHSAFLIGKIKDVVPAHYDEDEDAENLEGRFLIEFSEYARVDIPNAWRGGRYPIRYANLADLAIDPSTLHWEAMPARADAERAPPVRDTSIGALAEAKRIICQGLNVSPEAVEITIRA